MKNPHSESSSPAVVREDSQRGAALLEYALVVALIAVVGISGVRSVGQILERKLLVSATAVLEAGAGSGCDTNNDPFCQSGSN